MNETVYVYIVHSDIDENNIYAEFATEEEAIDYARRNKDELTYVDKVEVALDEDGDIIEEFDSETIWVYDEEDEDSVEEDDDYWNQLAEEEEERKEDEALLGDTTWFEDLDTDSLVETLEENEDIVECKECFELFPKEECTKIAIGYICPECGKIHSHEEPEFEIDSIPDVVIADEDTFKIDFPELERTEFENDMIPYESTPEIENGLLSDPEPMAEPCVGPECEAPVEAPVTKEETITKLVVDEHEAIDGYEKAKIEIEANSELGEKEKEEILDTIEHIKEEEIEHIEELEELVDEAEETKADESTEESKPEDESEVLVEGSGFLGKIILDDYFKKDGQRNPGNKNGTGYWVDLIDPDTKESIIKPEDKKTVQKLKEAETIATHLSRAEDGWAIIRVEGAQGWNGILEVYEKGKRTQDITQKKLANLNKAWDEQEATKKARKALDKSLGKDKPKDVDNIDLHVNNNGQDNQVEAKIIPTQGQLRSAYRLLVALLGTRAKATEYITVEGKGINAKYNLVQGKTFDDASLKIKELQKAALGESLTEHINEEHPAIESDQKLVGIDNAVVDCKVNKVITHSEDEKPVDCKGEKKPLEKPLTEELGEDKLQVMEEYLKSTKFASLDTEWEAEGDIIGAYLDYNTRKNMFILGLSIYHASEDNNAEYPERHTDEEEFSDDSLAEMYEDEDCKEILDRLYEDNLNELIKPLTETKCKDCGGEVKDGKCTSCNELVEARRTGDFVKLVNDKFRTDQPVSVYDLKCLMKSCDVTVKQQGLSKINLIIDFDNNCEIIQETEKAYLVSVPCYFRNPKDRSQILDTPNYIAVWAPKSRCVKLDPVTEATHAQVAKPEGSRTLAYNNALTYAKKANKPYIYGYTNHTGKFFAAEIPMKVTGSPAEAEKEFRSRYKNCSVIYVVYPDKEFIRESLYNFTPEEQAEYGIDEDGNSLDSYDTYVRCNWCKEVYTEDECKFEANLGWLCPRCQEEIRYHGEPLTIIENPSEEQIKNSLEETIKMTRDELMAKEGTDDVELINAGRSEEDRVELVEETAFESKPEDWAGNIAWGYFNYWKYRGSYTTVEDFIDWCSQEENPHVDLLTGVESISKASPEVQKAVFKLIKERLTKACEREINDLASRYNYAQKTLTKALTDLLTYFKNKNNSAE